MGQVSIRAPCGRGYQHDRFTLLQRLDRDDVSRHATPEDRVIYEKQILEHGMIDAIGLADASGQRMCVVPGPGAGRRR